jgi:protein-S-isoprenylcysteine O-methyltransferase Ste14
MKNRMVDQARREFSPNQRSLFLICIAPIFLVGLPYFFISVGSYIDRWLNLAGVLNGLLYPVLGALLALLGWLLAMWSIYAQFTLGRGTPVPVMATQKLIVQPPFTHCRNPMTLGTLLAYLGVAIAFHSPGAGLLVLIFISLLLVYIKRVEEKELALRFGDEYLAYKQRTPFLLPRFWGKS